MPPRVLASGRLPERWIQRLTEAYEFTHVEWDEIPAAGLGG